MVKVCSNCNREKNVNEFYPRRLPSGVISYRHNCKVCQSNIEKHKVREGLENKVVQNLIGETWLRVSGFNGYMVSNYGRIKSLEKSNKLYKSILKPNITKKGYCSVALHFGKDNKYKRRSVHRIVAIAFIKNPNKKPCVNHIDNNPSNNCIKNLEWCTYKENLLHAKRCGRMQKGTERHNNALSEKQVLEIFASTMEQRPLAKIYNVHQGTVAKIKTGQNWSHLTGKVYAH